MEGRHFLLVAHCELLIGRAQEGVLPIDVKLDHTGGEVRARRLGLLGELAGARGVTDSTLAAVAFLHPTSAR